MSKGTARRAVRIDDELWGAALAVAAERGDKLSDIIRAALTAYIKQWGTK